MARGLKFQIKVVEGLYCPYSENKCADQYMDSNFKPQAIFCVCTDRFVSDLVRNPEDGFSHKEAHFIEGCGVPTFEACQEKTCDTNSGLSIWPKLSSA